TLEFYEQLNIATDVVQAGFPFPGINLWVEGERRVQFALANIGRSVTPFPYVLIFPQDEHENLLIAKLAELGVNRERNTELLALEETGTEVHARIRLPGGNEQTVPFQFVAGCDGARSVVRHAVGAEFQGGTYPDWFYVADVEGSGAVMNGELHLSMD